MRVRLGCLLATDRTGGAEADNATWLDSGGIPLGGESVRVWLPTTFHQMAPPLPMSPPRVSRPRTNHPLSLVSISNLVLSASHVQRDEGRSTGALPRVYSVVSMTLRNTHEIDDGRSLDPGRVTDTDEIDIS